MPLTRNQNVPASAVAFTRSPTWKPYLRAVPLSITTSSPRAHVPSARRIGLNCCAPGSTPNPNVGLPFDWIAFPCLSIRLACVESPFRSMISPAAALTSRISRICRSVDSETVALPPFE